MNKTSIGCTAAPKYLSYCCSSIAGTHSETTKTKPNQSSDWLFYLQFALHFSLQGSFMAWFGFHPSSVPNREMYQTISTHWHISFYGTCFPIQQDHLLLWQPPRYTSRLFWDTDHTAKGNTKSSPILNYCEISIRRLSWGCSIQIQFGNIFSAHNSIWIWKLWKSFVN